MTNKIRHLALTFCFISCSTLALKAQDGIVTAGGNATGAGGSVSYSIGQVDYITATGSGGTSSQGIEQPNEIFVSGIIQTYIDMYASVYPNPFTEYIILSFKNMDMRGLNYTLYDVQGKMISQNKLAGEETNINMKELSSGIYFIKVMNDEEVKTFKLIKK